MADKLGHSDIPFLGFIRSFQMLLNIKHNRTGTDKPIPQGDLFVRPRILRA
jgi:hypothetical protein